MFRKRGGGRTDLGDDVGSRGRGDVGFELVEWNMRGRR